MSVFSARWYVVFASVLVGLVPILRAEDEVIGQLTNHPEVRAARLEVELMSARATQKKLEIGSQLLKLQTELDEARQAKKVAEQELAESEGLPDPNRLRPKLAKRVEQANAVVERIERFVKLLAEEAAPNGQGTASAEPHPLDAIKARHRPTHRRMEKLLASFEEPTDVDFEAAPLRDAMDYLSQAGKVKILIHRDVADAVQETSLTLNLEEQPLGAILQAIEDQAPQFVIVVREYGLLVVDRDANDNQLGYTPAVDLWLDCVKLTEQAGDSAEDDEMQTQPAAVVRQSQPAKRTNFRSARGKESSRSK